SPATTGSPGSSTSAVRRVWRSRSSRRRKRRSKLLPRDDRPSCGGGLPLEGPAIRGVIEQGEGGEEEAPHQGNPLEGHQDEAGRADSPLDEESAPGRDVAPERGDDLQSIEDDGGDPPQHRDQPE